MANTFKEKPTIKKLGILEFLKDEGTNIFLTCKNTIISFLQNRNISHEGIFQDKNKNFMFFGKITSISQDEVITLRHTSGNNISIPMDYVENVSLSK
jgi:hypothetical protein